MCESCIFIEKFDPVSRCVLGLVSFFCVSLFQKLSSSEMLTYLTEAWTDC